MVIKLLTFNSLGFLVQKEDCFFQFLHAFLSLQTSISGVRRPWATFKEFIIDDTKFRCLFPLYLRRICAFPLHLRRILSPASSNPLKWMNALLVSQEELFHPLICSNLKGRAANGNFFLPYPAPVPNSSTPFLCPALLQHFGFPLDRKVTSDLMSKGSYLFIKMLSGQYSAGIGSQAGFSCKLLALCSIAWSWQGIYCNFEHPVRQHLSFRSHPDFNRIKGQNSPLDKNISPWWLHEAQQGLHRPFLKIIFSLFTWFFSLYLFSHSSTSNFSQHCGISGCCRRNPWMHLQL